MPLRSLLLTLALLVPALTPIVASADDAAANGAAADDAPQYKPMPWHLVDLWWDLGEKRPFESYSVDVTISETLPDTTKLYIAPVGIAYLNKIPFYGGLQSNFIGYTRDDPKRRWSGHGLLMSMWGERSLDAVRTSIGGYRESSGHEGDFVGVRRPYKWTKGTYTYRVVRMDEEVVDGTHCTWVGAFLYSHEKNENVFIGALRFPSQDLVLSQRVASFVEVYGPRIPVDEIPRLTVTFGNLKLNGKPVPVKSVDAVYADGVPDYAEAKPQDGKVVIEVGQPVERTKRRIQLWAN